MNSSKITFGSKKGKSIFDKPVKKATAISYKSETPNIEQDAEQELTELQQAFRDKAKKEKELKEKNANSEFWSCIVFKTQEQRDQFFELLSVASKDNQYIDGQKLIKALELRIAQINEKAPGKFKVNKTIADLAISL